MPRTMNASPACWFSNCWHVRERVPLHINVMAPLPKRSTHVHLGVKFRFFLWQLVYTSLFNKSRLPRFPSPPAKSLLALSSALDNSFMSSPRWNCFHAMPFLTWPSYPCFVCCTLYCLSQGIFQGAGVNLVDLEQSILYSSLYPFFQV